jgi:hypothetical protein
MVYTESASCDNIAAIVLVLQWKNLSARTSGGCQHSPITGVINVFAAVPQRGVYDLGQAVSGEKPRSGGMMVLRREKAFHDPYGTYSRSETVSPKDVTL